MKIYNTLTKLKEELIPRRNNKIDMFVCGPTVYDYIHIGNARTFVFFDVVAKYLRLRGYEVNYIQNITDIDDKIINRAEEANERPLELSKRFTNIFFEDMKSLNVTSINRNAPATEHIAEVIAQVKILISKKNAYLIPNDGYYFDLTTFPDYGKLSGRTARMADDSVSRIDENPEKRNKGDFCLWKFSKPALSQSEPIEPTWPSEFGPGRPGWHIEDTAITEHYFGPQYDIHGGGQDLIFPHHEAEIAQQESVSGLKPFVRYWLHTAFLINSDAKMSKSLGNFATVRLTLEKYSSNVLRFYFLSGHYRAPLDFSEKNLMQAEAAVNRLAEFYQKVKSISESNIGTEKSTFSEKFESSQCLFYEAMDDDFNVPMAIGHIFSLIKEINPSISAGKIDSKSAGKIGDFMLMVNNCLNIIPDTLPEIPPEISKLVAQREDLRQKKMFTEADQIRDRLSILHWQVEDTIYGPLAKKSTGS